jgi:hypothetical protein
MLAFPPIPSPVSEPEISQIGKSNPQVLNHVELGQRKNEDLTRPYSSAVNLVSAKLVQDGYPIFRFSL